MIASISISSQVLFQKNTKEFIRQMQKPRVRMEIMQYELDNLTEAEFKTFEFIVEFFFTKSQTMFFSHEFIGKAIGYSRQTVCYAMNKFYRLGLLGRFRRFNSSNVYRLCKWFFKPSKLARLIPFIPFLGAFSQQCDGRLTLTYKRQSLSRNNKIIFIKNSLPQTNKIFKKTQDRRVDMNKHLADAHIKRVREHRKKVEAETTTRETLLKFLKNYFPGAERYWPQHIREAFTDDELTKLGILKPTKIEEPVHQVSEDTMRAYQEAKRKLNLSDDNLQPIQSHSFTHNLSIETILIDEEG